jgi:hypothetical protein
MVDIVRKVVLDAAEMRLPPAQRTRLISDAVSDLLAGQRIVRGDTIIDATQPGVLAVDTRHVSALTDTEFPVMVTVTPDGAFGAAGNLGGSPNILSDNAVGKVIVETAMRVGGIQFETPAAQALLPEHLLDRS